jgi:hypothetical protein
VLNLGFRLEKFLTPWLSQTLGTFIYDAPDTETVIARPAFVAGKPAALWTRIKGHGFSTTVLVIKLMLANDTHTLSQRKISSRF